MLDWDAAPVSDVAVVQASAGGRCWCGDRRRCDCRSYGRRWRWSYRKNRCRRSCRRCRRVTFGVDSGVAPGVDGGVDVTVGVGVGVGVAAAGGWSASMAGGFRRASPSKSSVIPAIVRPAPTQGLVPMMCKSPVASVDDSRRNVRAVGVGRVGSLAVGVLFIVGDRTASFQSQSVVHGFDGTLSSFSSA